MSHLFARQGPSERFGQTGRRWHGEDPSPVVRGGDRHEWGDEGPRFITRIGSKVLEIQPRFIDKEEVQPTGMRNDEVVRPRGLAPLLGEAEGDPVHLPRAQRTIALQVKRQRGRIDAGMDHAVGEPTRAKTFAALGTRFPRSDFCDLGMVDAGLNFVRGQTGRKRRLESRQLPTQGIESGPRSLEIAGHALADKQIDPLKGDRGQ